MLSLLRLSALRPRENASVNVRMTPQFSLYLDIIRFLAAMCVLLSHGNAREIIHADLYHVSLGHNAVIVFFMLSGYVIAYVADARENNVRSFWISRIARIYSVALPAILLTPLLDIAGEAMNPSFYLPRTTHDYWWVRIAASMVFTNELWLVSIMPFSNSPYWSLCYEVCYYLLFSVYCFETGLRRKILLTILSLIIGPKILLLFPIWVLGVVIYRYQPWKEISENRGWLLVILSLLAIAAHRYFGVYDYLSNLLENMIGSYLYKELHFSKHFLSDYVLMIFIAMNFIGVRAIAHRIIPVSSHIKSLFKHLSAYTFALYLFHLPLLFFFFALIHGDPMGSSYYILLISLTLITCLLLGALTEVFKHQLRNLLLRLWKA